MWEGSIFGKGKMIAGVGVFIILLSNWNKTNKNLRTKLMLIL